MVINKKISILIFYLLPIFLIQFLSSCESPTETTEPTQLEETYQLNSQDKFGEYLLAWNNEIQPIKEDDFNQLPDTLKAVYKIFQEFYNPSDLGKYCTVGRCPEFGNGLYSHVKCYIVQKEIIYTLKDYEDRILVSNFKPNLDLETSILFLSKTYKEELDSFLNIEKHGDDINNRFEFLNSKLKIIPGHWFGWHFITHPEVEIIYFNESLDSAIVHFRIVYEGGEARFAKTNDDWKMYESKLTWIE